MSVVTASPRRSREGEHPNDRRCYGRRSVNGLARQGTVLARIASLAGFYDIELAPAAELLAKLGPELSRGALVTVPVTFDRLAIDARVPRERLDELVDRDQLRRVDKLVGESHLIELQVEVSAAGVGHRVRALGSRSIEQDCELLAGFGVGTLALDSLRDCAAHLGIPLSIADRARGGAPVWQLQFAHRNRSDAERATTRARVLAVARKLGATAPQCNLIDGLHDTLAKDRDSYSTLIVDPESTTLQLAVRWQHVRWETVIRMAIGFRPNSDVGQKLGELSGAFNADEAEAIELLLGPSEPPELRVAVACA